MKTTRPTVPDDPILSPAEMAEDGNISVATWNRNYRHRLPVIQISPRRIGVRRSAWLRALAERTGATAA
jgi:hypothetical protein